MVGLTAGDLQESVGFKRRTEHVVGVKGGFGDAGNLSSGEFSVG